MVFRLPLLFTAFSLFSILTVTAQEKKYDSYSKRSRGGLCSQTYLLFKDGTYCSESGCEASSRFSFGKWLQKKDTVKFIPANLTTYNFVQKVEREKTQDSKLTVFVFDREGRNITNRIGVGQKSGNNVYPLDLDSSETKQTDWRRNNGVLILGIKRLFRTTIEINIDSSNIYKIYLNISGDWIFSSNSGWDHNEEFSLIKKKDKLVAPFPDNLEGDVPVATEYILQKD